MAAKYLFGVAGFLIGVALTVAVVFGMRGPAAVAERPGTDAVSAGTVEPEAKADRADLAPMKRVVPDVKADLRNAIKAIESADYVTYIEMYEPIEWLRELRQHGLVEQVARSKTQSPGQRRALAALKEMTKHEPKYDASRGVATFEFDLPADEPDSDPAIREPPRIPLPGPGYGSDLSKVISEAVKSLAARDYERFVNAMLPPMLPAPFDPYRTRSLVEALRSDPQMAQRMTDDLKALADLQPELSDLGNTASFKLGDKPPGTKGATTAEVGRVIKFSLVNGDWRFFHEGARVSDQLMDFGNRHARDARVTIRMERIGGNWRLLPFDL